MSIDGGVLVESSRVDVHRAARHFNAVSFATLLLGACHSFGDLGACHSFGDI